MIGRTNWLYTNSFQPISGDLVGTVRWDEAVAPNGVTESFFPWGEERGTVTGNDRAKWGTYWRDSESSLDYAMNRYYSDVTGRFLSPDPYGGSAKAGNPQSWNRYAYVLGDPVGGGDPTGLDDAADGSDGTSWFNFSDFGGEGGYGGSSGSGPVQYTGSDITGYDSNGMPIVGDPATSSSVGVSTEVTPVAYDPSTATVPFAGVGSAAVYASGGGQGGWSGNSGNSTKPIDWSKAGSCLASSVSDHYGLTGAAGISGLLSVPISKALVPPYRVIGAPTTNLFSVLGHFLEINVPGITIDGLASTNLLRIVGRANPYVAAGLVAVDAGMIGYGTYACYQRSNSGPGGGQ